MFGQYEVSDAIKNLNLGCGQPGPEYILKALPLFNFRSNIPPYLYTIMQYGKKDGHDIFKNAIIETYFLDKNVNQNDIFMTGGVSQGIQMITGLLNKIKTIYVEELTYFIMLNHFKDCGFTIKTFSLDNLDKFEPEYNSMMYLIPFCNNPIGKSITYNQLMKLLPIIDKYNLKVLSDETYFEMQRTFDKPFKPLYFYSENIISFHTFSKIYAPGVRLGWLMTKNEYIIKTLNNSGFIDSGGSLNPIMGLIVAYIIKTDLYKNYLSDMIRSLDEKRELICKVLDLYSDVFSYTKPDGGYFIFVKLNDKFGINSDEFLEICKKNGITFHQGWKFTSDELKNTYNYHFRLSCSYYSLDDFNKYFSDRIKLIVKELYKKNKTIWVLGSTGRLGSLIVKELENKSLKYKTINREFNLDKLSIDDLIVDVSSPEGTKNLLTKLTELNLYPKIIIGTTGNLPMNLINSYPGEIIVKSNFSEGIPLVLSFLEKFDKNYWTKIEIKDFHHVNKKDAPSGTAKTILNKLESNGYNGIEVQSYREGDIIGIHEIILSNDVESITIKHEAKDRRIFAVGCVNLICKLDL